MMGIDRDRRLLVAQHRPAQLHRRQRTGLRLDQGDAVLPVIPGLAGLFPAAEQPLMLAMLERSVCPRRPKFGPLLVNFPSASTV